MRGTRQCRRRRGRCLYGHAAADTLPQNPDILDRFNVSQQYGSMHRKETRRGRKRCRRRGRRVSLGMHLLLHPLRASDDTPGGAIVFAGRGG